MMKIKYLTFISLILPVILNAKIINVPSEVSTIQAAIDASADGDTVLVQPGTYVENLNFNGKNITLTSQFLFTQDKADIQNTVLDGGQNGSVVLFVNEEDSTAKLCGFTITNGSAYYTTPDVSTAGYNGGGIYCSESSPILKNLVITGNSVEAFGGGIFCNNAYPRIISCKFLENAASSGGAIFCNRYSIVRIFDSIFERNDAKMDGGAIQIWFASLYLKRTTFRYNTAGGNGGAIAYSRTYNQNYTIDDCNIYLNEAKTGRDLYFDYSMPKPDFTTNLDTFTVEIPTSFYAYPPGIFNFKIKHHVIDQVSTDLFVSPSGSDDNDGTSLANALHTITKAFSIIKPDSANPPTIHISNGIYSPGITNEQFPLLVPQNIIVRGESKTGVILDAEHQSNVLILYNSDNTLVDRLTLTHSDGYGGCVKVYESRAFLKNLNIHDNKGNWGAGLMSDNSILHLEDLSIFNNQSSGRAGGINSSYSKIYLSGVSVMLNHATGKAGGIFHDANSQLFFDPLNRCNIYLNHSDEEGHDLLTSGSNVTEVILDTFTVLNPTEEFAIPLENYSFDILHSYEVTNPRKFYVSEEGSDLNLGNSWDVPLKTINAALSKIPTGFDSSITIYVASGNYSPQNTGEPIPIRLKSNITISGAGQNKTIIDGNQKGSVFYLSNLEGVAIENLTITGGNGTLMRYRMDMEKVRFGGGVFCKNSQLTLRDVSILRNTSQYSGGGIWAENSDINLENADIVENSTLGYGGGASINGGTVQLAGVKITRNWTDIGGGYGDAGGIIFYNSTVQFSQDNRCSIYLNNAAKARDISSNKAIDLILDTFTLLNPTSREVGNISNFTFDILHESRYPPPILYVSPEGDNENRGDTPGNPLESLTAAVVISNPLLDNPVTIYLGPGIYKSRVHGELFPLLVPDHLRIIGSGIDHTVLDGDSKNALLRFREVNDVEVESMTLLNSRRAIYCLGGTAKFYNLRLTNNYAKNFGGALFAVDSEPYLQNVLIDKNDGLEGTGAIYCWDANPILVNVTVVDNNPVGLRGYRHASSKPKIINSIFRNNTVAQIVLDSYDSRDIYTDVATIAYSNIQDSSAGITTVNNCRVIWLEGNMDADPLFVDPDAGDYTLSSSSPCIDAGIDSFNYGGININFEQEDYFGLAPDMGAFEYVEPVQVYPGDTDNNGLVNAADILPIGIYLGTSGLARNNTSIEWIPHEAELWPRRAATFADTDGDGLVSLSDINAIILNWNRTHAENGRAYPAETTNIKQYAENFRQIYNQLDSNDEIELQIRLHIQEVIGIGVPEKMEVAQNYPNPFNPETKIVYKLPKNENIELTVFNIRGQRVRTLLKKQQWAGTYEARWDGTDDKGQPVSSGIYFYRLTAGGQSQIRRMVLIR
ncbi:MAG TPA: T9SS type A sorting domain-containing protein [Caldithrix abyssi]|uniref:Probable pectate lyase C n=1 Tax=Caldithrix abyssi TaxID=187145 RepID=A0A7V4U2M1_CALAY|nr:T9SS type A sorting domain-containing protein [Caldithrix abyssi]